LANKAASGNDRCTSIAGRKQDSQPTRPPAQPPAGWRWLGVVATTPVVSSLQSSQFSYSVLFPFRGTCSIELITYKGKQKK